jgi:hypothetical protein
VDSGKAAAHRRYNIPISEARGSTSFMAAREARVQIGKFESVVVVESVRSRKKEVTYQYFDEVDTCCLLEGATGTRVRI